MAPGIAVDDIVAVRGPLFNGSYMTLPGKVTAAVAGAGDSFTCDITIDAPGGLVAVTGVFFDITLALITGVNPACIQYTDEEEADDFGVISDVRKSDGIDNLAGVGGGG
tara:strand:- start:7661 stop:7987 length:327 start_codon:yes stop_codon:yes gene_type:complete